MAQRQQQEQEEASLTIEDYQDDVCSYNSDDDVSIDRSDATYDVTYDVEYPADDRGVNRPVIQPDITEEQTPETEIEPFLPIAERHKAPLPNAMNLSATLPNVSSDASIATPEDVDPDSLSAGLQTTDDDDDDDPKTVVDKNRDSSFESSRDLDSEGFEPECSFRDQEIQFTPTSACASVCPSRASVDSHKSISFFIDLDDGGDDKKSPVMSRSVSHPSRREKTIYRRQSQNDRMTQSMYDTNSTSSTPTSGVTFFVDLNDVVSKEENVEKSANRRTTNAAIILKTMSREESDRDLTDVSEDMQIKSKMLMERSIERTQVFFNKLKEYIDYLGKPSYSKEELKKKKYLAENITRLMFEEEENLRSGRIVSDSKVLDKILFDGNPNPARRSTNPPKARPRKSTHDSSRLGPGDGQQQQDDDDKPVLRRERTFDLDPKMSVTQVTIPINSPTGASGPSPESESVSPRPKTRSRSSKSDVSANLEVFQQQRILHTKKLKKEILKLEKMENYLAAESSSRAEKESPKPSKVAPEPQKRQCWAEKEDKESRHKKGEKMTSFKTLKQNVDETSSPIPSRASSSKTSRTSSSMSTSSCSWFIPSEDAQEENNAERPRYESRPTSSRRELSKGSQTGDSLIRQFRERKDKGVYVRDRPQAYFLTCEEKKEDLEAKTTEGPIAKPRTIGIVRCYPAREQAAATFKTTVIDLETETLPEENNLQEAFRRHRPDYIARAQDRDRDRMVRSLVADQRRGPTPNDVMSRSSTSLSTSSNVASHKRQKFPLSSSPYQQKNSNRTNQFLMPHGKGLIKESSSSNSIGDRPTSSSSTKSRIPRTTSASSKPDVTSSVNGSTVARINEPLQLRGPNTASVYSVGFSSETKQKDSHYKTNRSMTSSRSKVVGLSSVGRTDNGQRTRSKNPAAIYKSMLDSSKVMVR